MITQNKFTIPSSRREAFWGALPFLAFGLVSMITKFEVRSGYL